MAWPGRIGKPISRLCRSRYVKRPLPKQGALEPRESSVTYFPEGLPPSETVRPLVGGALVEHRQVDHQGDSFGVSHSFCRQELPERD